MRKPGSAGDLGRVRLIAARMFRQGLKTGRVAASPSVDEHTSGGGGGWTRRAAPPGCGSSPTLAAGVG